MHYLFQQVVCFCLILATSICFAQVNSDASISELDKKGWSLRKTYPDSTNYYTDLIIDKLRANGDTASIAKYYNYKGIAYYYKGDNYTSYRYYSKAQEIATLLNDSIQLAHSFNNLGRFFLSQGNYVKSFDFSNKALAIFDQLEDFDGQAYSLKRIAEVYAAQGYLDKALDASKKVLSIRLERFDKNTQATAHIDLAAIYFLMDSVSKSQEQYLLAIKKASEISSSVLIATGEIGLSEISIQLNHYDSAIFYARKAKEVALNIENNDLLFKSSVQLGKAYYYGSKILNAKEEFETILESSILSNQLDIQRSAYYYLARINSKLGNGMKAFEYQLQFDGLDNQLNNIRDKRAIDSLLFKQELEQQARENNLLSQKDKELIESHRWQNQLLIATIISILVALIFIYRNASKTRVANRLLIAQKEELNATLDQKQVLENQLLNINERFQAILNSGNVSIISTTTDGVITHFSKGAENLLGYVADEMVDKQTPAIIHDIDEVIARGEELSKKYDREIGGFQVFITEAEVNQFESREWTYIRKDGSRFPVQLVVSVLRDNEGNSIGYLGIATDISEQKSNEKRIRKVAKENEHYRDILENVEDIIYELDGTGNYIYVNPATCRISGYSSEEMLQLNYLDLVPNDQKDSFRKFYTEQAVTKTESTRKEFHIVNKKGEKIWIRQTTTMFFGDDGIPQRILAVAQNINEIHELRLKLDEQLKLYRLVSENSQDLIALHNPDGSYLYVSPSIKTLLGYEQELLIGENPYDYIHPDDHERLKEGAHQRITQGQADNNIEYRVRKSDGAYIWFEAYTTPVYDDEGKLSSFQTSSRDITERKKQQDKVKRYQEGLRLINNLAATTGVKTEELINNSLEIVANYLNLELGILSEISGNDYVVKDFYSSKDTDLKKGQKFDFKTTYCDLTYSHGRVVSISEMKKSEYNGHPCYENFKLESYIGAIIFVNKEKEGTVNFSSQTKRVDEFDELDEDFIALYANWVGANIERSIANQMLREEKERAEIASRAKTDFLSVMSHEIRTPLNGILGLTNLLMQERPRKDQVKNLNLLKFSGDNLLVIINDILDFNKIEAGKINLENTDFNLYGLLESIQETNAFKIQEKKIDLILNYSDDLPHVFIGDSVRLGQVVNNLVSNAIKFTEKGAVTIEAELGEKTDNKARVKIMVKDTGKGIDNSKFEKIFERFSQEEDSTTRLYGGTGLGLPITKNLLNIMGSDIKVESELGKGSTFSFELELTVGDQSLLKSPDLTGLRLNDLGVYNLNILIAEDNDINYLIASNYLKKWNVKSDQAKDGEQAVKLALTNNYHLILMDLQMPKLDGYDAVRQIRKHDKNVPILALTASVLEEVAKKVHEVGMNDMICKPMTPHELYEKITRNLNIRIEDGQPTKGAAQSNEIESTNQIAAALEKMSMGDQSFVNELIRLCTDNLIEFEDELIKALNEYDLGRAKSINHKIKGALVMLNITSLQTTGDEAEQVIISNSDSKKIIERIKNQVSQIKEKLSLLKG